MKKYEHLLFDLDNTIWDFDTNSLESLKEVYSNRNLGKRFESFEQFSEIYHRHNKALWIRYQNKEISKFTLGLNRFYLTLSEIGIDDSQFSNKLNAEYLANTTVKTRLIKDAYTTIINLSKRYKLHIITNGFFEVQFLKIRNSKIEPYFANIITSEESDSLKPDDQIFAYALKQINTTAEKCIIIGDDFETDIIGAKNANIDQVFFNRNELTDFSHKPTYEITELKELLEIF